MPICRLVAAGFWFHPFRTKYVACKISKEPGVPRTTFPSSFQWLEDWIEKPRLKVGHWAVTVVNLTKEPAELSALEPIKLASPNIKQNLVTAKDNSEPASGTVPSSPPSGTEGLNRKLTTRHLTMIAIGGGAYTIYEITASRDTALGCKDLRPRAA
jgi:hypothetical protein